jgi:predicted transcriptional regulator
MARPKTDTTVLTVRVPTDLERRLSREAHRRRTSRSEVARAALEQGLGSRGPDLATEARRQSRLVSSRGSRREEAFWLSVADTKGWK